MSFEYTDARDAQRHRNMQRIAGAVELPSPADAARKARWQQAALATDGQTPNSATGDRHGRIRLAGAGVAAAVITSVLLTFGQPMRVSAAMIFSDLAAALRQSVAVQIENVDFGNVRIDGELLLPRSDYGAGDVSYAEIHALMRSSNPEWNDIDAVLVICQTPEAAWQFGRGNGISTGGDGPVAKPTEYFIADYAWEQFTDQPLDGFGCMPLSMGAGYHGSQTQYRFTSGQRRVTETLLHFLLDLSSPSTTDAVVHELADSAEQVMVRRGSDGCYVLRASGFERLGALAFEATPTPDISDIVRQIVWTFGYNPTTGRINWSQFDWPERAAADDSLSGMGITTNTEALGLPLQDADSFIALLEQRAMDVEIDNRSSEQWRVAVTGYPFPVSSAGLDWLNAYLLRLRDTLTLEVVYDAATRSIRSAEFRGFAGDQGIVRLTTGAVEVDAEKLKSDYWVTSDTDEF